MYFAILKKIILLALPLKILEPSIELIEEGIPSKVIVLSNSSYIALSDLRINLPVFNNTLSENIIRFSAGDTMIELASISKLSI